MNEMELEGLIEQSLHTFYQGHSKKLNGLQLRDILKVTNPHLFRIFGTRAASKIVDGLLEMYLLSDEDVFIQTQWEDLAEYPAFYPKFIFLMNGYTMQSRIEFEQELANAEGVS